MTNHLRPKYKNKFGLIFKNHNPNQHLQILPSKLAELKNKNPYVSVCLFLQEPWKDTFVPTFSVSDLYTFDAPIVAFDTYSAAISLLFPRIRTILYVTHHFWRNERYKNEFDKIIVNKNLNLVMQNSDLHDDYCDYRSDRNSVVIVEDYNLEKILSTHKEIG